MTIQNSFRENSRARGILILDVAHFGAGARSADGERRGSDVSARSRNPFWLCKTLPTHPPARRDQKSRNKPKLELNHRPGRKMWPGRKPSKATACETTPGRRKSTAK